jgi:hypothetical protein
LRKAATSRWLGRGSAGSALPGLKTVEGGGGGLGVLGTSFGSLVGVWWTSLEVFLDEDMMKVVQA